MSALHRIAALVGPALGAREPQHASVPELEARLSARLSQLGLATLPPYVDRLKSALSTELPHLAGAFTNGWTWFLRDQAAIDDLAAALGPDTPRVWVAGCATGEEAYSVALAFLERGLEVDVVGTDVDARRIEHAARGEYDAAALRRVEAPLCERYFERVGPDRFRVGGALRRRVTLRVHNLLDPPLLPPQGGAWDAIVCRNVLIHLAEGGARVVHDNLLAARPRHLLLGPADGVVGRRPPRPAPVRSPPPPAPIDRWSELGHLIRTGALSEARAHAERLTRTSEHAGAAHLVLGNLAQHAHDLKRAEVAYDAAELHLSPTAELFFLRGTLLRRAQAWDEATLALRRATLLDPDLWPAWFALAGAIERRLGPEAAAPVLRETARAIERRPRVAWRSYVDELEGLSCPRELVRAACERVPRRGDDDERGRFR